MSFIADNECSLSRDRVGRIRGKFSCPREQDPFAVVQMLNRKVMNMFPGQEMIKLRRANYPECPKRSWWIVKWDSVDSTARKIKIELTDDEGEENNENCETSENKQVQ